METVVSNQPIPFRRLTTVLMNGHGLNLHFRRHRDKGSSHDLSLPPNTRSCRSIPFPAFPLLPLREHLLHIDRSPAQRLLLKVGIDVRGGLVVGVAHDLHGDQRVDAALVEQRHVVVPEVVRGQRGLDLLKDVVRAGGARLDLPPCHAAAGQHHTTSKTFWTLCRILS